MNVSIFSQMAYEYKHNWTLGENKPNSNPIKACPERIEFTLSIIEGNGPICILAVIAGFIYTLPASRH